MCDNQDDALLCTKRAGGSVHEKNTNHNSTKEYQKANTEVRNKRPRTSGLRRNQTQWTK
ncbi:hypothetical protein DPMN_097215 [Dreissena polymorpha]|uniref:Uncharacterized protein n=1 Tax=Dreissena polymorpha TaxID=45954 RepID=A0A9D4R4J1_DREPO|nr:hypothetical protein DPMN_097215 [Dreissena polymorpha]